MDGMDLINSVFEAIKGILGEREMGILDLVDALEAEGFDSSDISYSNAHLVVHGQLTLGSGGMVSVKNPAPLEFVTIT